MKVFFWTNKENAVTGYDSHEMQNRLRVSE